MNLWLLTAGGQALCKPLTNAKAGRTQALWTSLCVCGALHSSSDTSRTEGATEKTDSVGFGGDLLF